VNKDFTVRVNISDGSSVTAFNARQGEVHFGSGGGKSFSPVELLLAAVGGCSALDFTKVLAQRGHPLEVLDLEISAKRAKDARLESIEVRYLLPAGIDVDDADLEVARRLTSEVLCTVSRTLVHSSRVDHLIVTTPNLWGASGVEREPAEAGGSSRDAGVTALSPAEEKGETVGDD
jgi:uncharacterized OsmC-like protein